MGTLDPSLLEVPNNDYVHDWMNPGSVEYKQELDEICATSFFSSLPTLSEIQLTE